MTFFRRTSLVIVLGVSISALIFLEISNRDARTASYSMFETVQERMATSELWKAVSLLPFKDQIVEPPEINTCQLPKLEPDSSWIPSDFKYVNCSALHGHDRVRAKTIHGDHIALFISSHYKDAICKALEVWPIDDWYSSVEGNHSEMIPIRKHGKESVYPCPYDYFQLRCYENQKEENLLLDQLMKCVRKKDNIPKPRIVTPKNDPLDIFIVIFDSISRTGWLEQLPKTARFAEEELGAVVFDGYNIVADGTTGNVVAFLAGLHEQEMPEARRGFENASTCDSWPLLWKRLRDEAGYVTLWDEDCSWFGTFHYRLMGFNETPVDYYLRPYENYFVMSEDYCLGELSAFTDMLQQIRHLGSMYPESSKFVYLHTSPYTHVASKEQTAYLLDQDFVDELRWLRDNRRLDNAALIMMGDHGPRYGDERGTFRGKLNERLPYFSLSLPQWFREKYPLKLENLRRASKQLVSHFDLHATLLDLSGYDSSAMSLKRGISFFNHIPLDRTCEEAGIEFHWCSCLDPENTKNLEGDDPLIGRALKAFETFANEELLKAHPECAVLHATDVLSAQLVSLRKEVAQFQWSSDTDGYVPEFGNSTISAYLQLAFKTEPGGGQWEVSFQITGDVIVAPRDQISRTNMYGDAPRCVQDRFPKLREFCYCKEFLEYYNY